MTKSDLSLKVEERGSKIFVLGGKEIVVFVEKGERTATIERLSKNVKSWAIRAYKGCSLGANWVEETAEWARYMMSVRSHWP